MSSVYSKTPQLMGIINATPDSFSDGGKYQDPDKATAYAESLALDGAAIIDIGGSATGPGSSPCDEQEELDRVLPIVKALSHKLTVSVDTYRASVAEACLKAGAKIINDVSGLRYDPKMPEVVSQYNAWVVVMYSKQPSDMPHVMREPLEYENVVDHIKNFLEQRISYATGCGLKAEQIILDPGMGAFISDNPRYSWEIIEKLSQLKESFPQHSILIGASRKGFLGGSVESRDPLSQMIGVISAMRGVDIIRTHNVKMAQEFLSALKQVRSAVSAQTC